MLRSDQEIAETNKQIEKVLTYGPEEAILWLRSAFHTHQDQLAHLREKLRELRALYLAKHDGVLSVPEARLLNVCRVCRGSHANGVFVFNFGQEFAHLACLEKSDAGQGTTAGGVRGEGAGTAAVHLQPVG